MPRKEEKVLERLLRQFIPPVDVEVDESIQFTATGAGWELISAEDSEGGPTQWAVWRGYFDLSGIVEKQQTLFTVNPMFQEGCDWNYTSTNTIGALQVWDILSQEYITNETFNGVIPLSGNWIAPGFSGGQSTLGIARTGAGYELEDIHYGNARSFQFAPSAPGDAVPFLPNQTRSSSWGVGSATAGQKLYITRALHITSALEAGPGNLIRSPPTAIVVPALIAKETDLRYIERLRRSYVIQPTVD